MSHIISPSLLKQINELDVDRFVPPDLHLGWEELLEGGEDSGELLLPDGSGDCNIDSLLLAASQQFEGPAPVEIDDLFLEHRRTTKRVLVNLLRQSQQQVVKGSAVFRTPVMPLQRAIKTFRTYGSRLFQRRQNSTPSGQGTHGAIGLSIEWRIYRRRRSIAGTTCVWSLPQ